MAELTTCLDTQIIVDTIPNGLFVIDREGKIKVWNRRMEQMTGFLALEVMGESCSMIACKDEPDDAMVNRCPILSGDQEFVEGFECRIETKTGERVPVLRNARGIRDEQGTLVGVLQTVTDLRPIRKLEEEVTALRQVSAQSLDGRMVGKSHCMKQVYEQIRLGANSEATVLVLGETGTGKELAVEEIHGQSARKDGPLVKVNCSALSEGLLESELFGHVKGAFTGAINDKVGRFELADGGTIFLDEIGDISPLIQVKLLRVLQERQIERVGDAMTRNVNVRVIAATHRDLRQMVNEGEFREDLYYRLRVFPIHMPPLRDRKEDIPMLINHFIGRFNKQTGKEILGLTNDARHAMMDSCWRGNVRELENAIEHAFVTCQDSLIDVIHLPIEIRMSELRSEECRERLTGAPMTAPQFRKRTARTKEELEEVLREVGWNRSEAARVLDITRVTVWRKMKQWGIEEEG